MTQLIEIKEKIVRFFGAYEFYMMMVIKFALALVLFMTINANIGYMSKITSTPIAIILAMICSIMPVNTIIVIAAVIILLDMYALSLEAALVTLILFAIIYFVYFRFAPKDGIAAVLTPLAFRMKIPYLMPMATGLTRPIFSVTSIICGTMLYYFIDGVRQSASSLTIAAAADEESATSKINVILGQFSGNKEMMLTIVIFVLAFLIVYLIRKMNIDHAWTIAIISGTVFQVVGLIAGYMILNISGKMIGLILGNIVAMLLAFVIQFVLMDLDYARTERVQFSDDEYFYYVKAVPKKMVTSTEKTIKRFSSSSATKNTQRMEQEDEEDEEASSRKVIAKELDIDENLLK